ncbi:MAG: protoheme IX farnesyltransferase [Eudoraea sp.]|nr:protoheme IX farnesyltransferase [Eudoraea sp.]
MKSALSTAQKTTTSLSFQDLKEITKHRLSVSVVFSSIAGYLLGASQIEWTALLLLGFGCYCMVGASNAFNQVIERKEDAIMDRTRNRPIPSGRMSVQTALIIASSLTVLGIISLYILNPKTAFFGALSIVLYTCAYTPLKKVTPLSVFVGAIPGAIPFMLGWVAATNDFGIEPGTLFMIQFFWQFPHFWALGWMLDDDYKKAGFKMLPTGEKNKGTLIQIIMYTLWMIVISLVPAWGITGRLHLSVGAAVLIGLMGMIMLLFAFQLYRKRDNKTARKLMLASVSYITLMQIVFVIDKFV